MKPRYIFSSLLILGLLVPATTFAAEQNRVTRAPLRQALKQKLTPEQKQALRSEVRSLLQQSRSALATKHTKGQVLRERLKLRAEIRKAIRKRIRGF